MSLLIAALAIGAAPPVAEAPVDHEIEVVAKRLDKWRGTWRVKDGDVTCTTKRSTGDIAIDAVGCDAMMQCMAPIALRYDAIQNGNASRAETQRQVDALLQGEKVGDCLADRRDAGIAALVDARRSKRT
jgi:hypothetical protein